jgi:eukaryotic-like serine/threonine-protein kinase
MPEEAPAPAPENQDEAVRQPIFDQDPFQLAEQMLDGISEAPFRPNNFGPYNFIGDEPIGIGNMGEVWLAKDTAANRRVAIKFLRDASDTDAWATRETQRLGSLDHQYIARLYTRSAPDDESRWLAMEYVEGEPLDKYFTAHHCSIKERLSIFRRICEAVQYAHSRQIIHGDLKPSNIRVKADGEPKLLDFGLAQQFQNPETTLTQSPPALGFTPAYAAPEQFRGEPIGLYIDVYALGVILYELLTGKRPFDESRCTVAEMKSPTVNERVPERPSIVAGRQEREPLHKAAWRDLDAICLKALAPSIGSRYASVEALIRDLDHHAASEPIDARLPHTVAYRVGRFVNRYRRSVVAVSAFGLVILGLIGFFTFRLAKERDRALAETARTQKVKQFFLDTFSNATEDALPSEKTRFATIFLDRGVRDIDSLAQDPALQAELYEGFGAMYQDWGDLDRAEHIARRALAKAQNTSDKDRSARLARAKITLGNVLEEKGRYAEAIAAANEALGSQIEKADYPVALTLLANAYIHLGDFPRADALNQQALNADRALYGGNSGKVADDLMNLGNILLSRGQYGNAEKDFRQALAINESIFGKESAQAAESASYVAQALYFQGGREKEEATILEHALATLEKTRGDVDQRVAFTVAQMGANALELKDLDGAEKDFLRAAAIYRAIRGDEHQSVAIELSNVASVYLEKKEFVRAEQAFRDVIDRFAKASLPRDNINVGIARIKLGHALLGQKRYTDAEPDLLGGYEAVKKSAPSASWLAKGRHDLAEVYDGLKQPDKAAAFRAELAVAATRSAKQ